MRLIDAHKLWDVMDKATLHHIVTNTLWNTLKSVIENAPTIDAVEVVRCRDCRYWHSNTEFCSIWSFNFQNVAQRTLSRDYCSRGERKGEVDE